MGTLVWTNVRTLDEHIAWCVHGHLAGNSRYSGGFAAGQADRTFFRPDSVQENLRRSAQSHGGGVPFA